MAGQPVALELVARSDDPQMRLAAELRCAPPLAPDAFEQAVAAARAADVAIVAVGLDNDWETEGRDRTSLDLPGRQVELIRAVAAVQPRTVVAVVAGSPVDLSWASSVPGLLWCWLPGQEGGPGHRRRALRRRRTPAAACPAPCPPGSRTPPPSSTRRPTPACSATRRASSPGTAGTTPGASSRRSRSASGSSYATCTVGAAAGGGADGRARGHGRGGRRGHQHRRSRRVRGGAALRRRSRRVGAPAAAGAAHVRQGAPRARRDPRRAAAPDHARPGVLGPGDERVGGRGGGLPRCGPGTSSRALSGPATVVLTERWTAPGIGSDPSRVASTGCTRSSGSGTSPGPRGPTRRSSCGRRRRRWRPSATTRRGWWRPAGASSTGTPRRRRCGGSAPGC